jgi:hypothetical protein
LRAFSSASAIDEATVVSRRTSASPKAWSRSWFSMTTKPCSRSPVSSGAPRIDRARSVPWFTGTPSRSCSSTEPSMKTFAAVIVRWM